MKNKLSQTTEIFGLTPDGRTVNLFTFLLAKKIKVSVMNYGATLTHLFVPDKNGQMEDVVLGFDDFDGYIQKEYLDNYCYIGSTVGRVAGRTADNQILIDDQIFALPANQGHVHLHGGIEGWDKKIWESTPFQTAEKVGVAFKYQSADGEEHYPGKVDVTVTYSLDQAGILEIHYQAETDQKTILNPTNHSYFNLSGDFIQSIDAHLLQITAEHYMPLRTESLPTGVFTEVNGSPFDFRKPGKIGITLENEDPQLQLANGIDHAFLLDKNQPTATLHHPGSGRVLHLSTTEPAVQVYSGNYLNKRFEGKKGVRYDKRAGICLETQHFADSTHHSHFPTIVLNPGETFDSKTKFWFSIQ
ncbi:aldose epimerase family protein [Rhodonellum sp.]|uniref:aldose epimerase family protein n=1 Tax=Rhodonellum sp. TaxID=2231180 RepID=UPI0027197902|nr:aldose epimerase family protein [Rhodonellum sp.]MDO9551264.1 aldose epimerase family protein [Rhodonellum sp.]